MNRAPDFCSSGGSGGEGAGDDVVWLSERLQYFTLTPGEGGHVELGETAERGAGGGGGVLVDGAGPSRPNHYVGEGYGGGGNTYDGGLPGGVLLDFFIEKSHNHTSM